LNKDSNDREYIPDCLSGFFVGGADLAAHQMPLKKTASLHRTLKQDF
jgi:hypothetical protein